ncbi:DUF998 domain-containing protein [Streptomyces sp. R302]|uniref:DUF998 domain-containing protein n=1 Tax=unclassified Streptomyces TaxID=2593676 RepID=UPI00145C818A|nr:MULTISPECIES: DUF998 domain-containing protein [unclassified Streptomyces]NML49463.1 DUF998 domain-containing protein [Streptomyces sp. R301]NML77790.1 DUF998 domain-containing protein [Streptomyces sp. R302]
MPGKVTRASAALLFLGALAYTAWVLEAFVRTGLDPVRTYVSELAAADQPLGGLFRATDLAAGLLVLAGAVLGLRAARAARAPEDPAPGVPRWARTAPGPAARRPWLPAGWAALALFGAATAVDSRLPLSCAATADPACAAREAAGLVPATHTAHAVSSGLAMTAALAAMVALTLAARRYGHRPLLARTGPVLVGLALAATAWTLAAVASFESGGGHGALGAAQRLQVLLVAGWITLLAVSVARERG